MKKTITKQQALRGKAMKFLLGIFIVMSAFTANAQTGACLGFYYSQPNFVNVSYSGSLTHGGGSSFTYEMWVKPTAYTGYNTYFSNGVYTNGILFRVYNGSSTELWINGNQYAIGYVPPTNTWTHLALVRNSATSSITLYANGNFIGNYPYNPSATNTGGAPMYLGASVHTSGNENYFGSMDEFRMWTIARTQAEIQANMNCEIPTTASGLFLNYHFNQGTGGGSNGGVTTAINATGATNGTLANFSLSGSQSNWLTPGSPASGVTCGPGAALNFDGNSDFVSVNTYNNIPLGNSSYTIEAWIKPVNNTVRSGIAGWGNYGVGNAVNGFRTGVAADGANGCLVNYWWGADLTVLPTDGGGFNLFDGNWHHVAATFDGTTRKVYVDGGLKKQDNPGGGHNVTAQNLAIGKTCCSNEVATGNMDEVRIWNVARTQAEIQAAMNCEIATSATGLAANYHFNQGTIGSNNSGVTTLIDASGNNNTGNLQTFALNGATSNWTGPGAVTSGNSCVTIVDPTVPTLSASSTTNCGTVATTLNIVTGTLNSATVWTWYSGSCGGTVVGTGTSISVSPTSTTTYFARGTGGGVSAGSCGSITITVNSIPTVGATISPASTITLDQQQLVNDDWWNVNTGISPWGQSLTPGLSGTLSSITLNVRNVNTSGQYTFRIHTGLGFGGPILSTQTISPPTSGTFSISITGVTVTSGSPISFELIPIGSANYGFYSRGSEGYAGGNLWFNGNEFPSRDVWFQTYVNSSPTICANSTQVTLSGTGASSYSWSGGVTNALAFTAPASNTTYTVTGTTSGCSATATQVVNVTNCIVNPTVPTLSASSTTNCGTMATTLSIATGTLNSATAWTWYSGSCGGTVVGTGTSISVSPASTTTYFARGTGGGVSAGSCGSITITVNPTPAVSNFSAIGAPVCSGSGATVTVSSTSLITGTYTVTYNVSGTNTVATTTASMNFTSGNPGTGTFTTPVLNVVGSSNVVNITSISNSNNCSSSVSSSTAAFTTNQVVNVSNFSASIAPPCTGNGAVVTVSSNTLATGTYLFFYNVSGTNTLNSGLAFVNFTAGNPGTGTFTTSPLSVAGNANLFHFDQIDNQNQTCFAYATNSDYTFTTNAPPAVSNFTATGAPVCSGSGATVTISSTSLITGTYTVTYNVSGTNTVATTTASMNFTAGNPGTGTFTTPVLNVVGSSNVVNVTSISNSNNCSSSVSSSTAAFTTNQVVNVSNFSASIAPPCTGNGAVVTVSSNTLATGTYLFFYSISGTNTLNGGLAFVNFSAGNPGTGTFTTSPLSVAGNANLFHFDQIDNQNQTCFAYATNSDYTFTTNAPPSATITASNGLALTCANPNTTLSVPTPGGTTQVWNQNGGFFATASNPLVTIGAVYDVTVTNTATGCTATSSVTTTLNNTAPTVSITSGTTVLNCTITSITLTASGADTYSWSGGGTGSTKVVSSPGSYTVTGTTTANGCSATSAGYSITQDITPPSATITASNGLALTCANPSTVLSVPTPGGTTQVWNQNGVFFASVANPLVTIGAVYDVTVTNTGNGCIATSSVTTTLNNTAPTVSITSGTTVLNCTITSITLTASGADTYSWSGGGTGSTKVVSSPGSYTVTGTTTANGCSATSAGYSITQDITPPSATITASNGLALTCANPSTVLSVPTPGGTTQVWNQNGVFFASVSNPLVTIGAVYDVTVTNTANGCTATSSVTTTLNNTAPSATISASNGLTFCNGSSTVLSVPVTGTTSQVWNQNGVFFATSSNPLVTIAATYDVTVTDGANGCTASSSVTTIVNALPVGSASDIVICNGDPSNLPLNSTIAGSTFTWTSAVTTGAVVGNGSCSSGCTSTISDVLTNIGFVHGVVQYTAIPTSPLGCVGAAFTANVTVGAAPAQSVISGPSVVCGYTSTTYSCALVAEATSYTWTVPTGVTGMTITSGQGTNSINVTISAGTTSGNVTCVASNNCGSSTMATLAVTKKPAQPGVISGPTSTCGLTTASYSIASVFGATSYAWTVPANTTITSGQGTTSITISMTAAFVYGQVKVSAVNNCGNVPATALNVTGNVPGTPVTVSGPANVCGASTATYSISPVAGATGYNWSISGAGTIVGSNTGTSVTVALNGTTGGSISCAATNVCGNGTPKVLNLSVAAIQAGLMTGPTTLCGTTTATYSVASVGTGYTYNWSLTLSGWSITSGQGSTSITITGPATGTAASGLVRVTTTNTCGSTSAYRTTGVTYCHNAVAMNNGAEAVNNMYSNIYPNPTSSDFTIDVTSDLDKEVIVEVYDVLGNLVIHELHQVVIGTTSMKTNIENYKNGMYFVRLLDVDWNVIHSQTVIKQ